jgi:hypothetical protein
MGEITRRITLYNRAYFLAWQGLPDRTKALVPDVSQSLDTAVRAQICNGEAEATKIAAAAVNKVFGPLAHTIYAPPIRRHRPTPFRRVLKRVS